MTFVKTKGGIWTCDGTADDVKINAAIDSLDTSLGGEIELSLGTFKIAANPVIDFSKIHFRGKGWGTHLDFAAGTYFSLANTAALSDITFENMYLDGADTATNAINSAGMSAGMRVTNLRVTGCYFNHFLGRALNLMNPELSTIADNFFLHNVGDVYIYTNGYHAGNITLTRNFFGHYHNGDVAVEANANEAGYTIGNINSIANHYYGDASAPPAAKMFYSNGSAGIVGAIKLFGDRSENAVLFESAAVNNKFCYGHKIIGCDVAPATGQTAITIGQYTRNAIIEGNAIALKGTSTGIDDNATSTSYHTQISGNNFDDESGGTYTASVAGCVATLCKNNFMPDPLGQKAALHRNGDNITYWGSNTGGFAASTDYAVQTSAILLTSTDSGNADCDITIKDSAGNTVETGLHTLTNKYVPWKYIVNWGAYTGAAPTVTPNFIG